MPGKGRRSKKRVAAPAKPDSEERYELFCLEYTKHFNGTKAYRAVYGENVKGADVGACRLLSYARNQDRIKQIVEERYKRVLLEGDEILARIQQLGLSDIRRLIDPKTQTFLPTTEWPDEIAMVVSSFKVKELFTNKGKLIGYIKEVKLWDKVGSLQMLGRNKKLFTDVVEAKNTVTVSATDEQVDAASEKFKTKL